MTERTSLGVSPLLLRESTVQRLGSLLPDSGELERTIRLSHPGANSSNSQESIERNEECEDREDQVLKILELLCAKNYLITVQDLVNHLKTLNVANLMETMLPDLERDCRHAKGLIMPQLTDAEVSKALSLKDIEAISKEKTLEKYKAVVLFNDKDVADNAFSLDLIERLRKLNLDLFVPQFDVLVGTRGHATSVEVIAERCEKVIAIYSPSFLECNKNAFLTKLAAHIGMNYKNSRKFIPIIFRNCAQPDYQMYHPLRYDTDTRIVNFWEKLYKTFEVTDSRVSKELTEIKSLKEYKIDPAIQPQKHFELSSKEQQSSNASWGAILKTPTVQVDLMKTISGLMRGKLNELTSASSTVVNVPFKSIEKMVNNFAKENFIGKGGFGAVYRGSWNKNDVAVKVIQRQEEDNLREFWKFVNEYQSMHGYATENILLMMGCCLTKTDPYCIIYQYMPNGSVYDRLRCKGGTKPLTWNQRGNIGWGTAKGLTHLHSFDIIHRDIKSPNILLDKHFEPKIGDFGLANHGHDGEENIAGTSSYLPEEYLETGNLSTEVDIFCYGIFLFELVTGKRPGETIKNETKTMRELMLEHNELEKHQIDSADPESSDWPLCLHRIGIDCTQKDPKAREPMELVAQTFSQLDQIASMDPHHNLHDVEKYFDLNGTLEGDQMYERDATSESQNKVDDPAPHQNERISMRLERQEVDKLNGSDLKIAKHFSGIQLSNARVDDCKMDNLQLENSEPENLYSNYTKSENSKGKHFKCQTSGSDDSGSDDSGSDDSGSDDSGSDDSGSDDSGSDDSGSDDSGSDDSGSDESDLDNSDSECYSGSEIQTREIQMQLGQKSQIG